MYACIYVYVYIYKHIYIYMKEDEQHLVDLFRTRGGVLRPVALQPPHLQCVFDRERESEIERERCRFICKYTYMYMCKRIYMYIYI